MNYIDSTVFMGLHHKDDAIRIACKSFFIQHFHTGLAMSLEEVGRCDDIVWQFPREMQDEYYPFMDRLHTVMQINRFSYEKTHILPIKEFEDKSLTFSEQLILASVKAEGGYLYTVNERLLALGLDFVSKPEGGVPELNFENGLETYYQSSLLLRINS